MRVTIVLETGGFFPRENDRQTHLDVGYFQTPGPNDIEVSADGQILHPGLKLGKGNRRIINVEHVENDGVTVKKPVRRSAWYELDILRKDDLYSQTQMPDFIADAYDCILRFHSGDFNSADVRGRRFTEHLIKGNAPTRNDKHTRAIANEIHVEYDIDDGEVLRLRGPDGDIWSSSSLGSGTKGAKVKILTHDSLKARYQKDALDHKGQTYFLPNSDPPPMNGPRGSG